MVLNWRRTVAGSGSLSSGSARSGPRPDSNLESSNGFVWIIWNLEHHHYHDRHHPPHPPHPPHDNTDVGQQLLTPPVQPLLFMWAAPRLNIILLLLLLVFAIGASLITHHYQVHLPWSKSQQGSQASQKSGGSSRRWAASTLNTIWGKESRSRSEENVSSPRETNGIRNWRTGTKYRFGLASRFTTFVPTLKTRIQLKISLIEGPTRRRISNTKASRYKTKCFMNMGPPQSQHLSKIKWRF